MITNVRLTGGNSVRGDEELLTYEQILQKFRTDIKRLATRYPKALRDDLYQEGTIALYDAYKVFIALPPDRQFRAYAMSAVSRRMIDYHRKEIKHAKIIASPAVTVDDEEVEDFIYNVARDRDPFSTATFALDYQVLFSEESLRARGLSDADIQAFHLRFESDLSVTDVATILKISVGQASKILTKVRGHVERLLTLL